MLQVKNIFKKYITGDLVQTALNDVSLNLRDNEFVAILGQSGSGKTTLLNVIGGLDRYDSGDLIINGISTKNYNDRDWDSYRNHTIGFVFQSYNLIPHQSVLANVELALTISGISGKERRERAIKALQEVGLGNQLHKKPNQMSGGQMQRVAIARALVNNPDILLADEPTGALDSETSVQVMDLLKEVAKDRLVVMVTHNPELAEQYATRIVRLSDGKIIDDSDPFIVNDQELEPPKHKNMGKSSMSFLTSLALSFNNLKTKKGRTFLTSFAGSIGIIGIALILSLSNGVNMYIHNIEEETLSEYPLTISASNVDLTSMIARSASASADEEAGEEVNERQTISSFFSTSKKNDLKSLKTYLESDESHIYDYANAVEYSYSITTQIYTLNGKSLRQVNPNESFSQLNSAYGSMSSMMPYNVFSALPENKDLYISQYDVLEGSWPKNSHEMVVILSSDNCVTDITLYALGLKDPKELDDMIKSYRDGKNVSEVSEQGKYKFSDFMGLRFKLLNISDQYQYDAKRKLYVDKSDDTDYMIKQLEKAEDLEIVGVIRPKKSSKSAMLQPGIGYPFALNYEIIEQAAKSDIVKAQKKNPKINVFTGKKFDDENKSGFDSLFNIDTDALSKAFNINTSGMNLDSSLLNGIDFSNINIDFSQMNINVSGLENIDVGKLLKNVEIEINKDGFKEMFTIVLNSYLQQAASDPSTDYANLPNAISAYLQSDRAKNIVQNDVMSLISGTASLPDAATTNAFVRDILQGFATYLQSASIDDQTDINALMEEYLNSADVQAKISAFVSNIVLPDISLSDVEKIMMDLQADYQVYANENKLPDPSKMEASFQSYLQSEAGKDAMIEGINQIVDQEQLKKQFTVVFENAMNEYGDVIGKVMTNIMTNAMSQIMSQVASSMGGAMSQLSSAFSNLFTFDQSVFEKAFKMDMNEKEFQEIMMAMVADGVTTYESNLSKLNYCEVNDPASILIYPKDFNNKQEIIKLLNKYNKKMEKTGQKDKVISYTDYVATLMSSVTDIIDTISYVLIAFVSISLVVSSIMIGIITYISVLERTKEIGILRAIGASKSNVSQVFNAETFIIGLLAGILGIVITLLLLIPGNMLIHYLTGGTEVNATLPWVGGIVLIIISVILTLIGGIIPSRAAAKKDPVTALRTE